MRARPEGRLRDADAYTRCESDPGLAGVFGVAPSSRRSGRRVKAQAPSTVLMVSELRPWGCSASHLTSCVIGPWTRLDPRINCSIARGSADWGAVSRCLIAR
jgi:hypothetical protein